MISILHLAKKSIIVTLTLTELSSGCILISHTNSIASASHVNHRHVVVQKRIRPRHQINSKHEIYLDHHTTGTLRLSKPLRVQSALDGDQRIITIPKGQVLHYKKQTPNVIVWNKHYPNNNHHQYDAYGGAVQQQLSSDAKNYAKNKKRNGMPNIYKQNMKRQRNHNNNRNRQIKPKLPKTSDYTMNQESIFTAILGLILGISLLGHKFVKYIRHLN